jgi:hypothetical protein
VFALTAAGIRDAVPLVIIAGLIASIVHGIYLAVLRRR